VKDYSPSKVSGAPSKCWIETVTAWWRSRNLFPSLNVLLPYPESGMGSFMGRTVEAIVDECDKDGNGVIDF
jgi:hypothetical protein